MQRLVFNFQGIKVFVESDWSALLSVIEKDFWSFRDESFDINSKVNQADVALKIILGPAPYDLTAKKVYLKTVSASVIDEEDFRYCDYGEGVVVRGDLKLETYEIHGVDFERVHEVTYLVLLSRVGKKLDIKGIHKLHAFAILFNEKTVFICMMPSGGGKSTLLLELLKDQRVKMLSDDIPLIDQRGRVMPFPMKIGLNEIPEGFSIIDSDENIYTMKRKRFGLKTLISTKGFADKVVTRAVFDKNIILALGERTGSPGSSLEKIGFLKTFMGVFINGVIGIGTPLVIEFFWEPGFKDFLVKTMIFLKRMRAFIRLSLNSTTLKLNNGTNPKTSAQEVLNYLEKFEKVTQ